MIDISKFINAFIFVCLVPGKQDTKMFELKCFLNIFGMKSDVRGCLYGETGQKVIITNPFLKLGHKYEKKSIL